MNDPQQDYPEHTKLLAIADKSQEIGQFVDWLAEVQGIWVTKSDEDGLVTNVYSGSALIPLLAEYFEIDLTKIEAENRRLLEALREQ